MTIDTNTENISTLNSQRIPLVECRPHFESALSRINDYKIEPKPEEKAQLPISDSFGSWLEWD